MIIKQEAIQLFHFPLIILPLKNGQTIWSLACPFFLLWWASRGLRNQNMQKPRTETSSRFLCWHYLFSRAVARKVFSAQTSLTSVFGMGTGGPSLQSIPTLVDCSSPSFMSKACASNSLAIIALDSASVKYFW